MKLAAIDIGSNAIRLQIVRVYEDEDKVSFKKLEFLRFPLRLGIEVFKKGKISRASTEKFLKLMSAFKLLLELYEIDAYNAVATSAMREANNGTELKNAIKSETGLDISIISGEEEARILNKAIHPYLSVGNYVHIDVGGGSTEVNVFQEKKLIDSKSLQMGSIRKLSAKDRSKIYGEIKSWIKTTYLSEAKNVKVIGTGGNINRMYKLSSKITDISLSLVELKALRAYVNEFSYEQKMAFLKMNPDRADVIIPATGIYIRVMEDIGSDHILVPRVGLKDGLIHELFERVSSRKQENFEFLGSFD